MISVFDMYKIGIGPSSSHTVGPMKAGRQFIDDLLAAGQLARTDHIRADVYGSLSLTGRGHNTDLAILLGLMGYRPDSVDIEYIPAGDRSGENQWPPHPERSRTREQPNHRLRFQGRYALPP